MLYLKYLLSAMIVALMFCTGSVAAAPVDSAANSYQAEQLIADHHMDMDMDDMDYDDDHGDDRGEEWEEDDDCCCFNPFRFFCCDSCDSCCD